MPICLNVSELQPGMKLYQAVCNDYIVLLPPGKVLDERDVDVLRRKYADLSILVADPLLDEMFEFQDNNKDRETAREAQKTMSGALSKVSKKLVGRTEIRSSEILGLQQAAQQVVQYLRDQPVTAILLNKARNEDSYLQEHSSNVFYTSMVLGNSIKQYILEERERQSKSDHLERSYALNLTPLGMGCLLQDIGMLDLKDVYKSVGKLTSEQRERLENHPVIGAQMLPTNLSTVAKMVVRTHHENFNGTGYPCRIPGEKLHVFSRIIRVADAFDAATSPRIYKKAKSEVRVLWEMTSGPTREHYDPVIIKVYTNMVYPFTIGAKLHLSNDMIGVVVKHNVKSPFHPHVIVAFDKDGKQLPKEQLKPPIDLHEHKDLKIVSYNGEDLSYMYTTSAVEKEDPEKNKVESELFRYAYP